MGIGQKKSNSFILTQKTSASRIIHIQRTCVFVIYYVFLSKQEVRLDTILLKPSITCRSRVVALNSCLLLLHFHA
jgi:hypothetical protein